MIMIDEFYVFLFHQKNLAKVVKIKNHKNQKNHSLDDLFKEKT